MASNPATTADIAHASPTVAACPKCNVVLVPAQVRLVGGARFVGGLLVFVGLIGCFVNPVGGFVLMGLGIVVMAVGGKQAGLMCLNCGMRGVTVGEIAYQLRRPYPQRGAVAVFVIALCALGAWLYLTPDHSVTEPAAGPTATDSAQSHSTWIAPEGVVLTRISRDHYRADDGTLIVTTRCGERAQNVFASLYFQADAADNKLTFPSGRSCAVDFVMR